MRTTWLIVGLLLAGAGLVWLLQGLNVPIVPRSFMTGDITWVLIGALCIIAGLGLAAWSWRRSG
jgi:hypothetical protein